MAVNNNTVTVVAGLSCSLLSAPPVGAGSTAATIAYQDGDTASDSYISVGTSSTPLNSDLNGAGFILISNPGPLAVNILVGATALGAIPPGSSTTPFSVVLPISDNVVINATVESGTQTVGVTVIETVANA